MNRLDENKAMLAALGRVPSGLFILTARKEFQQTGMLASWVQQCSFEPPLISVALGRSREMASWLVVGTNFTINILDDTQTDMLVHFGKGFKPGEAAFAGLPTDELPHSGPVLTDALAFLECRVVARYPAGDHDLVVAQPIHGGLLSEGHPMVHTRKTGSHY